MRTGVDIVDVSRFANMSQNILEGMFTAKEIEYCFKFRECAEHFAGCFAAKEAVMKVLGAGIDKIPVRSIEVLHEDSGRPFVVLDGEAKKLFKKLKLKQIDISISHTSTLATAFAIGM